MGLKHLWGLATWLVALALPLSAQPGAAQKSDPCAAVTTAPGVRFELAPKGHGATFQAGEIIPLVLSFTSETKDRYSADSRDYDRGGRLDIERYCVEPDAPDPLESYFKLGHIGGGLGGIQALGATPLTAEAELNEWRTLGPGHYRLWAISYRVWRPPDAREQTPYGRVAEVVRSNAIEIVVNPPDPGWLSEQLRSAVRTLAGPSSPEEARRAARTLRFLNTEDSTRQLAKLFWALDEQQPTGWDLMLGLFGSPYRQLAIDSMHAELAVPSHAIASEFLETLANLRVTADSSWDAPRFDPAHAAEAQAFSERREAQFGESMKTEIRAVVAALPRKTGRARALTLIGLLTQRWTEPAVAEAIRPALIDAWDDLPRLTQLELIEDQWALIAGPEMLPILRRMAAEPPPAAGARYAGARDAALVHLYKLDPAVGREAILRDLQDAKAQPGLKLVQFLPKADIAILLRPAMERILNGTARELDYTLLDRYGDASVLQAIEAEFESRAGKWACAQQAAMLRYFLRVAPEYGSKQVAASLSARKDTGCYRSLLQDLGEQMPKVERSAIEALDDPDLVQNAAVALGRWGSADAEKALWERLELFHKEWAGRQDQPRSTLETQQEDQRDASLQQVLAFAIAQGTSWICPPGSLARLSGLLVSRSPIGDIESWIDQWKQGSAPIDPTWYPEDSPTFQVLQYNRLTEDRLVAKLAQFPRGTQFRWQFWPLGQISPPVSMATQEEVYQRVRADAARHGIVVEKVNHP